MRKNKTDRIPKLTPYCYDSDEGTPCPYLKARKTDYGFGGRKEYQEYCSYLHKYLTIQDEVKDCEVR